MCSAALLTPKTRLSPSEEIIVSNCCIAARFENDVHYLTTEIEISGHGRKNRRGEGKRERIYRVNLGN
jgi:hypothetical protein